MPRKGSKEQKCLHNWDPILTAAEQHEEIAISGPVSCQGEVCGHIRLDRTSWITIAAVPEDCVVILSRAAALKELRAKTGIVLSNP